MTPARSDAIAPARARRVKRELAVCHAMLIGALAAGCGGRAAQGPTLTVFAASSLADAFHQMADSMRHRPPGLTLNFNFAGSQVLAFQLAQGAAADVFASADQLWMSVLQDSGLVDGRPAIFAHNRFVVIVPAGNPGRVSRLQDLARPGVKLVVAAEPVPAGRYTRQVIANLGTVQGFPAGYAGAVLANVVSNEESVKGVVTKVQLGEADAGFVYSSDVTPAVSQKVRRLEIPDEQNVLALYPIAQLRHARAPALAREFLDFVHSAAGQRVLEANGFLPRPS
jgi:molybdate transport system substrate-binding protein